MEKFTFTEDLYSYILLLPRWKRGKFTQKVIEYGLYDSIPRISKREQKIWDCVTKQLREEKAKRYVRQINGQLGGRKHSNQDNSESKKECKNLKISKNNLEVSKMKQKKVNKNDVYLFCLANGIDCEDEELNKKFSIARANPDNWREILKR